MMNLSHAEIMSFVNDKGKQFRLLAILKCRGTVISTYANNGEGGGFVIEVHDDIYEKQIMYCNKLQYVDFCIDNKTPKPSISYQLSIKTSGERNLITYYSLDHSDWKSFINLIQEKRALC
jgi:hypothetical protein